jgi:prepilin-type N-terminal cleavage/methylation domain-containing protein
MKKFFNKKNSGFTLVEIMVALGIFAIVAVVAVGAFMKIIDANKKSQTLKTAINNINFALESLTREMRVGSMYNCGTGAFTDNEIDSELSCYIDTASEAYVAFESSQMGTGNECNLIHAYKFAANPEEPDGFTLYKAAQSDCDDGIESSEYAPVISPDAVIEKFIIKVDTEDVQSKVFFRIKGYTGTREISKTYYDIQTTVSQRTPSI